MALADTDLPRCGTAFGTGVTMSLAVFGWLGLFLTVFGRPQASVRYLAERQPDNPPPCARSSPTLAKSPR